MNAITHAATKKAAIRSCRGFAGIGLVRPKNKLNVGSVLRAAGCFDAAMVAVMGARYHHAITDTMRAYRHLPLLQVDDLHAVIPFDCVPVAIERRVDAKPLPDYLHPERAFYIFGPEDGEVPKDVRAYCRDTVYVPSGSLNLAAAVNVVLYDRCAKLGRKAAGEADDV